MNPPLSVFLSRVTNEFKEVCIEIANRNNVDGRASLVGVIEQTQDLQESPSEYVLTRVTVAKLIAWIGRCTHFFHLAGRQHGTEAKLPGSEELDEVTLERALVASKIPVSTPEARERLRLLAEAIRRFREQVGHVPTYTQLEYVIARVYLGSSNVRVLFVGNEDECTPPQRSYRSWISPDVRGADRDPIPTHFGARMIDRVILLEIESHLLGLHRARLAQMITRARGTDLWEQLEALLDGLEDRALADNAAESFRRAVLDALDDPVSWIDRVAARLDGELQECYALNSSDHETRWLVHDRSRLVCIRIPADGRPRTQTQELRGPARVWAVASSPESCDVLYRIDDSYYLDEIGGSCRHWRIDGLRLTSFEPVSMVRSDSTGSDPSWRLGQVANHWHLSTIADGALRAEILPTASPLPEPPPQLLSEKPVEVHGQRRSFRGRRALSIVGDPAAPWVLLGGRGACLVKLLPPQPLHDAFKVFVHRFPVNVRLEAEVQRGLAWLTIRKLDGPPELLATLPLFQVHAGEIPVLNAAPANSDIVRRQFPCSCAAKPESHLFFTLDSPAAQVLARCEVDGPGRRVTIWAYPRRFPAPLMHELCKRAMDSEPMDLCPEGSGRLSPWSRPRSNSLHKLLLPND